MKRSRLPWLAAFPASVLAVALGAPAVVGTHPVRWTGDSAVPELAVGDKGHATGAEGPAAPPAPSPGGVPEPGPVPEVAEPWRPGMPQWGVHLYWEDDPSQSDAYITAKARQHADYLTDLGANSVALSFPFATDGPRASRVAAGQETPSPERLRTVLEVLRDARLRTTVRPLMDETSLTPTGDWRGSIEPADRDAWFASYEDFLAPYLEVAQEEGVATFTVGAELNSLEGDPHWSPLVERAEEVYGGEVSYDANWDNYAAGRIDMPVTHLGIDAYFPVEAPDDAPVRTLVDGWNAWLDRKSTGPLPGIVVSEAGIAAMDGAYRAPGDFHARRALNPEVQANWYRAVCTVVRERRMAGVYWWSVYFDDDPRTRPREEASRLDFAGRPRTERAIRDCFGSDYAGPGEAAAP